MAENIIKYGVFFIPPEEVVKYTASWKEKMCMAEQDVPYGHHPVHMTIFVCQARRQMENEIIGQFRLCCAGFAKMPLHISGWHVFDNDLLTSGDTLVISIELTDALLAYQQKLASAIAPYRENKVNLPVVLKGAYKESYDLWGFPFVGKHWHPHISIASARDSAKEVVNLAVAQQIPSFELYLDNLSLYRITDDRHTHLITVAL